MRKKGKLLSLLLCIALIVTLMPTTVFAEGNDGKTEATAVQCHNFAEFKAAMENSNVYYVELVGNVNEELPTRPEYGSDIYPATQVASNSGTKTLIISGNHTYKANGLYCNYATLILNSGRILNIKGIGQLTFSPKLLNESGSVNAVVWNAGGGTLNVESGTLKADLLNVATYGRAIYNEATLNITGGTFYGVEGKIEGASFGAVDINKGTATISGGRFFAETKETVTTAPYSLLIDSAANVQLSGGVYQNGIRVADTTKNFSDYIISGYKLVKLADKTQGVAGSESRESLTVVDPAKIISHVDVTLSNPVGGSAASSATASTVTTGAKTDPVEWHLINSDNSLAAELEGNFVAGNNYRAIIFVRPSTGYELSESVSATVNGASITPSRQQAGADGYVRLDFDVTAVADPDAVFTQQPSDQRISTLDQATATFKFSKEITYIGIVNTDTGNVVTEPDVGSETARKNADGSYTVSGFSPSGAVGEAHYAIRVKYDETSALVYSRVFTITRATPYNIGFEGGKGSATNLAGVTISYAIENEKVFITAASAPEGMEFDKWVVRYDSTSVTLENENSATTSFTMPAGEVVFQAKYKGIEHDITVTNGKATIGTGSEINKAATGIVVTITADPAEAGKQFDKWEVICGGVTIADVNSATTTFTMGSENVKVKATYKDAAPSHTHTYGEAWKSDDTNHWKECTDATCTNPADSVKDKATHTASAWIIDTEATATADGAKHKECTVCHKVLETATIPVTGSGHTHAYGETWKSDADNHWHECDCGDKADIAAHSFAWKIDKEATKTETGLKHEECSVCGKTRSENTVIDKLPSTGGGTYIPAAQKPEITIIGSGKAPLSSDGTVAAITPDDGHELVSVTLNGKEMGKVDKLTGLKTGDKVVITFRKIAADPSAALKAVTEKLEKMQLIARSSKTANKNIKVVLKTDAKTAAAIREIEDLGYTVKYKFYRSIKKSGGYKAMLTKDEMKYLNTIGEKGTMYYYRARVMVYDKDGKLVGYTKLGQCKYANRLWTK